MSPANLQARIDVGSLSALKSRPFLLESFGSANHRVASKRPLASLDSGRITGKPEVKLQSERKTNDFRSH
jgi:hypothetical protein